MPTSAAADCTVHTVSEKFPRYTQKCTKEGTGFFFSLPLQPQDLKDFMRQAGEVTYADAHKREKNMG